MVREAEEHCRSNLEGKVADYIPALACMSPHFLGLFVSATNGSVYDAEYAAVEFSIQSVSKPFVFALVMQTIGKEAASKKLGVNGTELPFNSVMAIDLNEQRAMNPMVNFCRSRSRNGRCDMPV